MARPRTEAKLPKARLHWRKDLLERTRCEAEVMARKGSLTQHTAQHNAQRLPEIMSYLIFSEEKKVEADLVYRHLFLECGGKEAAVFEILFGCAFSICIHESTFPFSPSEAQVASKVMEFYRPLFLAPDASDDTRKSFDAMMTHLKRHAAAAGRKGRRRELSIPQLSFILTMSELMRGKDGKLLESLFERIYKFTFGKKIHLPDYKNIVQWAEKGIKARLPAVEWASTSKG